MEQCKKTFGPIFKTMIFRYGPKYEWHMLGWLATSQERQIFVQKLVMDKFLLTSHFCSSFISFCPTQGHPTKAFSIHLDICSLSGLKRGSTKVPMHTYPFTCSYFYNLDFLLFVINPQHQPLIESSTNKNIWLAIM
jgi:hypothetical protein